MARSASVLSQSEMRDLYGSLYDQTPKQVPYAEFWGIPDDWARERLVRTAPPEALTNLKQVVEAYDGALDDWLGGAEADDPDQSDEYIAFSAMRIAAYSV